MEERRRAKRFDLSQVLVWVKDLKDADDPSIPFRPAGTLVDFSAQGLGIVTEEPLEEGDEILIRIRFGNSSVKAKGKVVRRTRLAGRGFEVGIQLEETGKGFLLNLIASHFRARLRNLAAGAVIGAVVALLVGVLIGRYLLS